MSDEIKEILDILKNCKDYDDEVFLIKQHSATLLLDYITNLQEENKELKKKITFNEKSRRKMQQSLMEQIETYKSRNEKAINILELSSQNKGICTRPETDTIQSALNVLNGGDKNV